MAEYPGNLRALKHFTDDVYLSQLDPDYYEEPEKNCPNCKEGILSPVHNAEELHCFNCGMTFDNDILTKERI